MKNCWSCAYRREIPGDAHVACVADFKVIGAGLPQLKPTQWSRMFPLNFDPMWMVGDCPAWSEKAEHVRANADDPLLAILGIFGGVGRL